MDPALIFLIVLIIGAVIVVIWFAVVITNNRNKQIAANQQGSPTTSTSNTPAAGAAQQQTGWAPFEPVPGDRGMCSVYRFPASSPTQPGPTTLNTAIIDSLTPGNLSDISCVDPDQLVLQKVNQTCVGGGFSGNVCYGGDGIAFQTGQTRQYYVQCKSTKCSDTLATVAINFDPSDFTSSNPSLDSEKTACLQFDSANPTTPITGERCNLVSNGQILRVERQSPDGTANDAGPYGRLFDRNTGLCIIPSTVPPAVGTQLQLASCDPANGYVWWFLPPSPIITTERVVIDGQIFEVPVRNVVPQQLVYYPNNGRAPPKGENLISYLDNNNPVVITVEVNEDGSSAQFGNTIYGQPVTMQPISKSTRNNPDMNEYNLASNAQTIDYWLYRQISQTPITCADCATNFTFD